MTKANTIPIHTFMPEDDLGNLPVRYVPLGIKHGYDFSQPHRHNYYEIFVFEKGGGTHLIDFVEYEVAGFSAHLVKPGQVHLLRRAPDSYGAVVHIAIDIVVHLGTAFERLQLLRDPVTIVNDFNTIKSLLSLLSDEFRNAEQNREVLANYLSLLVLKSFSADTSAMASVRREFNTFQQLVEKEFNNGHLPAWYARQLYITEKKLNELCKQATGDTVGNYLKNRLLLEARRLLSHTDASVKEIGYHLGFDDPAYFNRFFKKNTGITAGEFRDQYRQEV